MSRISSTFGKTSGKKSSQKSFGDSYNLSGSQSLRRSGSSGNLRKSGNLAASFGSMGDISKDVESEYIKNLQQQVYFLELEANHLREQARKATDMHPQMSAEAERMLGKLRQMQAQVDGLHLEVARKDSNLNSISTEKSRALDRLREEEDAHNREKRLLMEDLVNLKKEKTMLETEHSRKDTQMIEARSEMDKSAQALRNAEHKISILRSQLDQRIEQHKLTQLALEEKRSDMLRTESNLRELEEKYYSSNVILHDKTVNDLREEVQMLRQKLKETEMKADQDRYLRTKLSDDSSHLVSENSLLNQQVIELRNQVERERSLRENIDVRKSQNITELVHANEKIKQIQFEVNQTKALLQSEQDRCRSLMEQLSKAESLNSSIQLNQSSTQSRLAEVQGVHSVTESENTSLRRDKMLLVDHVSELTKQVQDKEQEILRLRNHIFTLENKVGSIEKMKETETEMHSRKWEEFEKLADSMRSLSHTMSRTAASPRHLDYN
ncbi:unnamed protein product [Owenia fusiformis]|uniref:Uncharacterized protein n=1 Tax=Owenia fusiformis TaxID=6347 RepID=A0A8J1UV31_OWEFU|nr:unnamed protein product [Owenia fusiformis]